MTTRGAFKAMITWEAKIAGNTESISQLNGIISEAIVFIGQSHPELLLIETIQYDIASENPTPFEPALAVDRVELGGGGLSENVTIPEEGKVVGPAPIEDWHKAYMVEGNAATSNATPKGLSVRLIGGGSVDIGVDFFEVTWKKVPLLEDDNHVIPDAWIPYLKQECLARIAMNRAKPEADNAKGYKVAGDNALKAHMQDSAQSTAQTN